MFVVSSASVVGNSHTLIGKGNEDSIFVARGSHEWLSCVVSDGCGSAKNAATGSKLIADLVGEALLRVATRIDQKGIGSWVRDDVISELALCRIKLQDIVGHDLKTYHATVVAALLSPQGGFLLHIGDGIAASFETSVTDSCLEIWQSTTSDPENGEYANETFYLTENHWIKHLHITPLLTVDMVMLCTDGAQDLLFDKNEINNFQLNAVLDPFRGNATNPNTALKEHLLSPEAQKRSSDDKSLILVLSDTTVKALQQSETVIHKAQPHSISVTSPTTGRHEPKQVVTAENLGTPSKEDTAQPTIKKTRAYHFRHLMVAASMLFLVGCAVGAGLHSYLRDTAITEGVSELSAPSPERQMTLPPSDAIVRNGPPEPK